MKKLFGFIKELYPYIIQSADGRRIVIALGLISTKTVNMVQKANISMKIDVLAFLYNRKFKGISYYIKNTIALRRSGNVACSNPLFFKWENGPDSIKTLRVERTLAVLYNMTLVVVQKIMRRYLVNRRNLILNYIVSQNLLV